jgi:O-antigen/teichoic acid export membrane protein
MTPSWLQFLPRYLRRRIAGRVYLQRVINNTGWVLAERILRYAIGFLVGVWIARYLGPEQYGLLNYAAAFVAIFAFMGTLGLDSIAVRDMVRGPHTRNETLGTLLLMRLLGGMTMVLVVAAGIVVLRPDDPRVPMLVLLVSLAQLLLAFDSIDCWFQANVTSRYAWAILAEMALFAIGMLAAFSWSGGRLANLQPSLARTKAFLAEGWPLMLTALVAAVSLRIDQVMLGQMAGYAEVGAYAIAVRAVEVTYLVPAVLAASIFPAMIKSKALEGARYEARIQQLYDIVLWTAVAISLPLSLLSGPIVQLLVGSAYAGAAPVLAILSWMPIFVFFGIVRQRWLLAENALRAVMAVEVCGCALNVLANMLLIPRYGAVGAAIASLIGAGGATLIVAIFSHSIRQSLVMLLRGTIAPLRIMRSG